MARTRSCVKCVIAKVRSQGSFWPQAFQWSQPFGRLFRLVFLSPLFPLCPLPLSPLSLVAICTDRPQLLFLLPSNHPQSVPCPVRFAPLLWLSFLRSDLR